MSVFLALLQSNPGMTKVTFYDTGNLEQRSDYLLSVAIEAASGPAGSLSTFDC